MHPTVSSSNSCSSLVPFYVSVAVVAVSLTAIGILTAPNWNFENAFLYHRTSMICWTSLLGASFFSLCLAAACAKPTIKNEVEHPKITREDVEAISPNLEDFFKDEGGIEEPDCPISYFPDVLKGLVCQYSAIEVGVFFKKKFGLNKSATTTLENEWNKRLGALPLPAMYEGIRELMTSYGKIKPLTRIDPLKHLLALESDEDKLLLKLKILNGLIQDELVFMNGIKVGVRLLLNNQTSTTAYRSDMFNRLLIMVSETNDQGLISLLIKNAPKIYSGFPIDVAWHCSQDTFLFILKSGLKLQGCSRIYELEVLVTFGWAKVLDFLYHNPDCCDDKFVVREEINQQERSLTLLHVAAISAHIKKNPALQEDNPPLFTMINKAHVGNFADTVQVLLRMGADKTIQDNLGMTPLDYAIRYELDEIIPLLS